MVYFLLCLVYFTYRNSLYFYHWQCHNVVLIFFKEIFQSRDLESINTFMKLHFKVGWSGDGNGVVFSSWWVFLFGLENSLLFHVLQMLTTVSCHGLVPPCSAHGKSLQFKKAVSGGEGGKCMSRVSCHLSLDDFFAT